MKTMIIYSSPKGRCRWVAERLGETLKLPAADVAAKPDCSGVDFLVLVGGGPYSGEDDGQLEGFVKRQKKQFVKSSVLISLDSSWTNSLMDQRNAVASAFQPRSVQKRLRRIIEEKQVEVIDEHFCLSRFRLLCLRHPNKSDVIKAAEWLEKRMALAQKVVERG